MTFAFDASVRQGAKENAEEGGTLRTPGREDAFHGLNRVRQAARLKKEAPPGVDGMTWEDYGQGLEAQQPESVGLWPSSRGRRLARLAPCGELGTATLKGSYRSKQP